MAPNPPDLKPPKTLSPSAMSAFTSCPLAYRFSYVERLPQPPSAPASKGTLVHRALQHLHADAPEHRTLDRALAYLERAREELANDPDFTGLDLTKEEWDEFHSSAEGLVRRYFEIEDPTSIRTIDVEKWMEVEVDGVKLRGIIDRLARDADGGLVITDYKTGSAPKERWEQQSLAGVHIYAFMCEQIMGERPSRVQLLYLSTATIISATPSDGSLRSVRAKSVAIAQAVRTACAKGDFRPKKSALCKYCSFQAFCPEFGGDPDQAAATLRSVETAQP